MDVSKMLHLRAIPKECLEMPGRLAAAREKDLAAIAQLSPGELRLARQKWERMAIMQAKAIRQRRGRNHNPKWPGSPDCWLG